MLENDLSVGDKIELGRSKNKTLIIGNNNKNYKSQLLDIKDENKLCIAMPIINTRLVPLSVGEEYEFRFYTKRGMLVGYGNIVDRYRIKNVFMLEIELISELVKLQRRQYYRLDYIVDITYSVISEKEMSLRKRLEENNFDSEKEREEVEQELSGIDSCIYPAIMTDISGGGARFLSDVVHDIHESIFIIFSLNIKDAMKTFSINGQVITSKKLDNPMNKYEYRVAFCDIAKEEREEIIQFIFDEERKRRRKEKGL